MYKRKRLLKQSRLIKTIQDTAKSMDEVLGTNMLENLKPKPMSLVKFDFSKVPESWAKKMPFKKKEAYLFLGEIRMMRGHGVFVEMSTGKVFCGYHIDEFYELTEDEI